MLQIILIVTYIRGLHLTPMQLNAAGSNKITVVEFQPANAWFILFSTVPCITGGSRLMRISLLRISLLRFFKKVHKFALWEFMSHAFGYSISLVQVFGQK